MAAAIAAVLGATKRRESSGTPPQSPRVGTSGSPSSSIAATITNPSRPSTLNLGQALLQGVQDETLLHKEYDIEKWVESTLKCDKLAMNNSDDGVVLEYRRLSSEDVDEIRIVCPDRPYSQLSTNSQSSARRQEIIKMTEQLIEAINTGDFEAYTAGCTLTQNGVNPGSNHGNSDC